MSDTSTPQPGDLRIRQEVVSYEPVDDPESAARRVMEILTHEADPVKEIGFELEIYDSELEMWVDWHDEDGDFTQLIRKSR